jgi:hypothetical protein
MGLLCFGGMSGGIKASFIRGAGCLGAFPTGVTLLLQKIDIVSIIAKR